MITKEVRKTAERMYLAGIGRYGCDHIPEAVILILAEELSDTQKEQEENLEKFIKDLREHMDKLLKI